MAATKTTTRTARRTAAPAPTPAPEVKAPTAPVKKTHRQLVADAVAAWQQTNQEPLTLVAHLAGTATAGSVWKVRTGNGQEKRARFAAGDGKLTLTGFEDSAKAGRSTKDQVAEIVANLGAYTVVQHSQGSVWTVADAAGIKYSYDRKEGTLTPKAEKKPAPVPAPAPEVA
jgi:hypothetical protein